MPIINDIVKLETEKGISIYNLTPQLKKLLGETTIKNGQLLVFAPNTTSALVINEDEERLLADLKVHLSKLVPESAKYLHNDVHLRDVPPDEPMNAHSHLMAMMLRTSEVIPVLDGKLALGTWQSVLFLELDGPRSRTVVVQIWGE
ncbi:MAG: YjbQ family protein [Symploca sp. SIO2E6]|nr:YjbQ family protein [Symploca sp. SIO2E6]